MRNALVGHLEYAVGAFGPRLASRIFPQLVWTGPPSVDEKVIYFTFDDGPTADTTPRLLDVLERHRARATFFILGRQADLFPELVSRINSAGHAVGLHGYEHLDAWKTPRLAVHRDLERGFAIVTETLGHTPWLYRPPYGRMTRRTYLWCEKMSLTTVMWTIMPGDFLAGCTPAGIADHICRRARPRYIVVLHDSTNPNVLAHTVAALDDTLRRLSGDGWVFASLSECEHKE